MPNLIESTFSTIKIPRGKSEALVFDNKVAGFGIRKFKSGKGSFVVQYYIDGRQRRYKLGAVGVLKVADARELAREALADVAKGKDPQGAKQAAREVTPTKLVDLVPAYLKSCHGKMAASYYDATHRYLTEHWKPLHGHALETIRRRDIAHVLDDIAETRGAVTADRAKAALSGLFVWAIERGHVEASPALHIKNRAKGGGRQRVLSEEELVYVWKACCGEGDYAHIVRLLILTGQRRCEIGDLGWSEIDAGRSQIDLPGARTKNERPHVIPLSKAARAIINRIAERHGRDLLFGSGGRGFQGWSRAKARIDERLPDDMEPWTVHDLRRSVVTHLAEHEIAEPHVIEAIVNHQSGTKSAVAGVYNKAVYSEQKRAALEAWGARVMGLVRGQ